MNATIEINGLRLHGYHGVAEQERRVGNLFEVSLRLDYPVDDAVASDNLSGTMDYGEVMELTSRVLAQPSQLLEHAVGRLRDALIQRYPLISGGSITLLKLTPPCGMEVRSVGVTLRW